MQRSCPVVIRDENMDLSDYRQVEYRVFNEHKFIVYPNFFN